MENHERLLKEAGIEGVKNSRKIFSDLDGDALWRLMGIIAVLRFRFDGQKGEGSNVAPQ